MVHICFDNSGYHSINHAMKLGILEQEDIICFYDDLSVGDISSCRKYSTRKDVIKKIYDISDDKINTVLDDFYEKLSGENDFIIWYAHNSRDYCNLYYVVSLLEDKNIKIVECDKKQRHDSVIFYNWVEEVLPEDLLIFLKSATILTTEEKLEIKNKWTALILEKGFLRAKDSDKVKTVQEFFYDKFILEKITSYKIRMARVVGEVIGTGPILKDWFIIWRLKELEALGYVEIEYDHERFMLNYIRKVRCYEEIK
jgi:hypothetical protein